MDNSVFSFNLVAIVYPNKYPQKNEKSHRGGKI